MNILNIFPTPGWGGAEELHWRPGDRLGGEETDRLLRHQLTDLQTERGLHCTVKNIY